jgi:glycerophosphoryl diester phosphodiesterase
MTQRPSPVRVIAHRGASGYLPEHTLEAKALAYAMGADYLEQDLVLTRDDVPVVLHDVHLDTVSNVAEVFPDRRRDDGRYYAIDFTMDEIRTLRASERFNHRTGKAVFPNRFPVGAGQFRIPSFEEEIEFIQGLNRSTGRNVGIYPELKAPAFHRREGKDLSRAVLNVLTHYGYVNPEDNCILQCFDADELKRVREELGTRLTAVQLLSRQPAIDTPHDDLKQQLAQIAEYAQGIGPSLSLVFSAERTNGRIEIAPLAEAAREAGLLVHSWTYRADQIPRPFESFEELHRRTVDAGVDAVFSDFPDQSVQFFRALQAGTDLPE